MFPGNKVWISPPVYRCLVILQSTRLYTFLPHMLLHRLNGHFLPVEYPGGQGGFHICLFKHLREMFNLFGPAGSTVFKRVNIARE